MPALPLDAALLHVDRADAVTRERIGERIHHGGQCARASGFPAAFHAERIGARGHRMAKESHLRRIPGARHGVIGEGAARELALRRIDGALHEALADALHDAALDLPGHDERVHQHTKIIDAGIAHHLRLAGVGIDLDLADMHAIRIGRRRGWMHMADIERAAADAQFVGQIEKTDRAVRALDGETAIGKFNVIDSRFEKLCRRIARFLDHQGAGFCKGCTAGHQ